MRRQKRTDGTEEKRGRKRKSLFAVRERSDDSILEPPSTPSTDVGCSPDTGPSMGLPLASGLLFSKWQRWHTFKDRS